MLALIKSVDHGLVVVSVCSRAASGFIDPNMRSVGIAARHVLPPRNAGGKVKLTDVIVPAPRGKRGGEIRQLAIENGFKSGFTNNGFPTHPTPAPPQRVARAMGMPIDRQIFAAAGLAVTNRLRSRLGHRYGDSVTRVVVKRCNAF
jgi:hypothetical protein